MAMDGRGGCCIARYAGGAYDMSKMVQIMLRFRPIAPKPASCGSVSCGSTPDNVVKTGRGKRKYVRESTSSGSNNSKRCNKKRKSSQEETVVTLPLLPETPEWKESPASDLTTTTTTTQEQTKYHELIWLNFDGSNMNKNNRLYDHRTVVMPQAVKVVGSCVTVERVMDTWMDPNGLGCTDEDRVRNLVRDTCPGFISDSMNKVTWTNGAYRRMMEGGEDEENEMMVWLVMKEIVPVTCPALTCRVRIQYTCRSRKEKRTLTLPCDVWRMDRGGFAWRLDVKAALCLGR